MKITTDPPPNKRPRISRLTAEIRALTPGQSVVAAPKTAASIAAHFRGRGLETRRATLGFDRVQIWIIAPSMSCGPI